MESQENILDRITELRKSDIAEIKQSVPIALLQEKVHAIDQEFGSPISLLEQIHSCHPMIAAAEFKRASPSKGDIALDLDIEDQVERYGEGGAGIISILTEQRHFKGTLQDMWTARQKVNCWKQRPVILRKDFIVDMYQLMEARAHGADTVLLIVAILDSTTLKQLIEESRKLKMEPLVEVNDEHELDIALEAGAKVIGVNNRNLRTFKLDLDTTDRICQAIQEKGVGLGKNGVTVLALSGIASRDDVVKFQNCGANGFLVGEKLMRSSNPVETLHELLGTTRAHHSMLIKVCGMTEVDAVKVAIQTGAHMIGMIFVPNTPRCITVATAKEIVTAVRKFGERNDAIDLKKSLNMPSDYTISTWFQTWADHIYKVTQHTPLVVGVFKDQSVDEINRIAAEVGLDMVQLHGDEGFEVCQDICVPVCRAVHLPDYTTAETVNTAAVVDSIVPGFAASLLLDTTVHGQHGGTGASFDWNIASLLHQVKIPCILAGGLNDTNVAKAIHIGRPFGVDVSSGVESSPGVKDHDKIRQFIHSVQHGNSGALPDLTE